MMALMKMSVNLLWCVQGTLVSNRRDYKTLLTCLEAMCTGGEWPPIIVLLIRCSHTKFRVHS